MSVLRLSGSGITGESWQRKAIKKTSTFNSCIWVPRHCSLGENRSKGLKLRINNVIQHSGLVFDQPALDQELGSSDVDERFTSPSKVDGSSEKTL